ncbi:bifunctional (p)ppGpp synthetase/guanosine-3',5'-bis(diphosphate) 3'-pyrophosphohydrolase [Bifidobacterium breve]|jgi:guanosine-3',5'-bis(diphosphate) 3'-pyrophosphohydrolase|uniref:Bifunctional (P)ppGpp synthetase/guanosine-3',5'-bis(Diphosphate) 3'-pyrophosphohydrolase n=1 Tax=Bifidobacterium breve TaxID=1685 RepID=A0AAW4TXF4_BIFBR|nr:bifunctional (p)ppGpp synthetase/guanosine-3',5'-bis(diphosphate) 3'-pyrophosphohydrolase [Bifidobacterium breve]MCB8547078.1 bifunctional (p)ppGpp synthetase/guanosine-3',5'-bis(diphosphate) 3'-pyrophosphohydrolase [Bifidobacterium sp. MSK23_125]MCB8553892.1 bifunctional (p)ppGpp synthetase/guanosine-3',5'-bis(diphosphate) 3'-pyrophosphohydrolase [Bifidobacterium sp. MSK23_139]MBU9890566.1 bifunctional (p)ppGpp synthetase/guanosine-3',5'-bis(diphosphate) 3'-pyrophosphohydrolase [Bifidobacter
MSEIDGEQYAARKLGCEISADPLNPLEPIKQVCKAHHPGEDLSILDRAYRRAVIQHSAQRRKSGEPYIIHPLAVSQILADLGMGPIVVAAGLLHDTVEDTDYTLDQCRAEFGDTVAGLVDGVTKLSQLEVGDSAQAETIRKLVVAMSRDVRTLVVKLADRVHNARTWRYVKTTSAQKKARETLDVYAPLANRLGMNAIKTELEELSFKVLYPKIYNEIVVLVARRAGQRDVYLKQILAEINEDLDEQHIKAYVTGRPKDYFSIYQKMIVRGHDFANIYDLVGVRIIVDTIQDCYAALGAVHARWNPVPGRFKDYIAMPKLNMYQSLHTTVVGPGGKPVEIQIRTWDMHRRAEFGIAAHWKYKENGQAGRALSLPDKSDRKRDVNNQELSEADNLKWIQQLADWTSETPDSNEFLGSLKEDLGSSEVYVFTPKGKIVSLPAHATPVDFAYAVHTEVGHRTMGARVNGRLVPLDTTLDNGDTVEILTSKSDTAGPSRDWLSFVKSPKARNKIRQWFSKERRTEAIEEGRDELTRAMRKRNLPVNALLTTEALIGVADDLNFPNADAVFAAIGDGQISTQNVISHLVKDAGADEVDEEVEQEALPLKPIERKTSSSSTGVSVKGVGDVWVKLARCCMPVPGDQIIGFITRNQGVSVHRTDCQNMIDLKNKQPERVVEVEWTSTKGLFMVKIQVEALDRRNLLSDVTRVLSDHGVNIISGTIATGSDRVATSQFSFEMADPQHLNTLLAAVRKIDGVFDVYRITGAKESAEPRLRKMK